MKKKPLIIGIVALLVVALVTALVFLVLDYQKQQKEQQEKENLKKAPGAHVVDDRLYTHFSGVLYVFDEKTNQIKLESAVIMDGQEGEEDAFEGTLSVMDYQYAEHGFIEGTPVVFQDGDFYKVYEQKTCRHTITDENGNNQMEVHPTDYEFTYCTYPANPDFLAVLIHDNFVDRYYVGIFAETEEEAKEGYQWFKANEP
ncbi:MAG: hypothetical protein E7466_07475 [Ruminococcaceae bacterium]|nr:hypothetical protein [Oscillospiraceae bacterium]MBQ3215035.1 hypothetical protein [Oscillospiraceae bacterium]